jgi:hypothetical protein
MAELNAFYLTNFMNTFILLLQNQENGNVRILYGSDEPHESMTTRNVLLHKKEESAVTDCVPFTTILKYSL